MLDRHPNEYGSRPEEAPTQSADDVDTGTREEDPESFPIIRQGATGSRIQ